MEVQNLVTRRHVCMQNWEDDRLCCRTSLRIGLIGHTGTQDSIPDKTRPDYRHNNASKDKNHVR